MLYKQIVDLSCRLSSLTSEFFALKINSLDNNPQMKSRQKFEIITNLVISRLTHFYYRPCRLGPRVIVQFDPEDVVHFHAIDSTLTRTLARFR